MGIQSSLSTWDLSGKRVIVRADLNVPLENGTIIDDQRLKALLPTLMKIFKKGGRIVLITHIGRPTKKDSALSTKHLISWFKKYGYNPVFADTISSAAKHTEPFVLLENVRFFEGEQKPTKKFAQSIADLGDYYINDAFGTLHRNDASITLVPTFFPPEKRSIGLLVEKELSILDSLLTDPEQPFLAILGGGKIADKLPLIESLIDTVTTLSLAPALVFTFLASQDIPVGKSLVDESSFDVCKNLLATLQKKNVTLMLPDDYQIAKNTPNGALSITKNSSLPPDAVGISIGPKTIATLTQHINAAKTIFVNGLIGFLDKPKTLDGMKALFSALAQSNATTILGGGDTAAAARLLGFSHAFTHVSTGGGATLTYLAQKSLPGLEPFIKK